MPLKNSGTKLWRKRRRCARSWVPSCVSSLKRPQPVRKITWQEQPTPRSLPLFSISPISLFKRKKSVLSPTSLRRGENFQSLETSSDNPALPQFSAEDKSLTQLVSRLGSTNHISLAGKIKMTTAAEKVAGTCYLLEEILIRLPAKSLARSKLVSKQWFSQISNPQFLKLHSRLRPNKLPTGMFLIEHKPTCVDAKFVSFNDLNPTYQTIPSLGFLYDDIKQHSGYNFVEIQLIMSCNGLLLCLVFFSSIPRDSVDHPLAKYCVCNPTTKKLRWLPLGPFFPDHILKSYLAFDPSLSLHYKVICIKHFLCDNNPHEIYIYSSENQCWSTYASPFYPCEEWFFLNGSMYCDEKSLRFDVYTEKMEQITMPPKMANCTQKYLPVIGSHLYCVVTRNHMMADLQVLEMSSDFSQWVPKYDGNIPGFKVVYILNPICVIEGVKEDELELVLGVPGKLISYNLKRKTTKELCALHGGMSDESRYTTYMIARVYLFIECLSDV